MNCRISDLRDKQVVCILNGCTLGPVCDVEFDINSGNLMALVVFGRCRLFGLFGREEDIVIPWSEIKVIGPDTILVGVKPPQSAKRSFFGKFTR